MLTEEAVRSALKRVLDPELGLNIVDLGLIYGIEIRGENVKITMTLTTEGCPLHDSIAGGVKSAVKRVDGVEEVVVDLVWDPPWTPELMSEEARRDLGYWDDSP